MAYESITLNQQIIINNIISVHYFEYLSDFSFPGESHNPGNSYVWTREPSMSWQEIQLIH